MHICQAMKMNIAISVMVFVLFSAFSVYADTKQWSGKYDGLSWYEDSNWFPSGIPTLSDSVIVDTQGSSVAVSEMSEVCKASSLTVGGRTDSTVIMENFVYGTIAPDNATDSALYIRKGGELILQGGGGVITLKGALKNSEEAIPDEPAFMFGAE